MNDIATLYSRLSLREDERKASSGGIRKTNDLGKMLVGKIMAPRKIPHGSIEAVFGNMWAADGKVTATPLEENATLFSFSDSADKERVLEREPWWFDNQEKYLIVLTEPKTGTTGKDLAFNRTPFWIHIHCVPWEEKTEETARTLGNAIGRFIEVEKDKWGNMMGQYLRVQCEIDFTKPIKRMQALEGFADEFPLQYEKLPCFCSFCGHIGHEKRDCSVRFRAPREERDTEHYPSFLRVNKNMSPFPRNQRRSGGLDGHLNCESVVHRIKGLLENSYCQGPFWVPRDRNFVAHSLANYAKSSPLLYNSWNSPPSFLSFVSGRFPEP